MSEQQTVETVETEESAEQAESTTEQTKQEQPEPEAGEGLHPEEIKMAKEQGLIKDKKEEKKAEPENKPDTAEKPDKFATQKRELYKDKDEQEKAEREEFFSKEHPKKDEAYFWEMRKFKRRAQAAERQRDQISQAHNDLMKRVEELEKKKETIEEVDLNEPVTKNDLLKLEEERLAHKKKEKEKEEQNRRSAEETRVRVYQELGEDQAAIAKADPEAEKAFALSNEILVAIKDDKLGDIFGKDKKTMVYIQSLAQRLAVGYNEMCKGNTPDENVAELAYEIGREHPKFAVKSEKETEKEPEQKNAGVDADKIRRMAENAGRRTASAAIGGGSGKRSVVEREEDLTRDNLGVWLKAGNKWSSLKDETRARLLQDV